MRAQFYDVPKVNCDNGGVATDNLSQRCQSATIEEQDRKTWLAGSPDEALALQRPALDDAKRIAATSQKTD
jgi:hypothetical protein